jgi:diguanylate cyclase (GGDEF)-like protein
MSDESPGAPLRALLVEDSEDDALLIARVLRRGGYAAKCHRVDDAQALARALRDEHWDIVITDHRLPQLDSQSVLSMVQESGLDLPFIIVSASIGEELAVEAMRAGAHDYVMKSNLRRLVPAVQRELREAERRRAHRRAQETIRHLAFHDALTGLVNRHEFEHRLHGALATARERGLEHALLYIDLDQFKLINDTCGHMAGDELLRRLTQVLNDEVRESDTLARLGGDEFGVLLESCPRPVAEGIARDILGAVRAFRFPWVDKTFAVGASIGLMPITQTSTTIGDILSKADMACYAAKDGGRNRIHVYSETDSELMQRHGEMEWVSEIEAALEDDRFMLCAQRIQPLTSDEDPPDHVELLIRLRSQGGGLVPPGDFIPAAERYGLMPRVDRWVADRAIDWLSRRGEDDSLVCFVNLSAASISNAGFVDGLLEAVYAAGIAPTRLGFEITETAAISDLTSATGFIRSMRGAGCPVALDDFGTGMSSFSYLKNLPVDFLKIDGGFVCGMLDDAMDEVIVESIQRIADVTGIRTIAEFVESRTVADRLRDLGVAFAQGFAVHRPEPLEDFDVAEVPAEDPDALSARR